VSYDDSQVSQLHFSIWSFNDNSSFSENCRQLEFRPDHTFDGKRLKNHVIRTDDVLDGDFCETLCYMEANCVSYNLKKAASGNGKYECELNNSTFEVQKDKLERNADYLYRGAKACQVCVFLN